MPFVRLKYGSGDSVLDRIKVGVAKLIPSALKAAGPLVGELGSAFLEGKAKDKKASPKDRALAKLGQTALKASSKVIFDTLSDVTAYKPEKEEPKTRLRTVRKKYDDVWARRKIT